MSIPVMPVGAEKSPVGFEGELNVSLLSRLEHVYSNTIW